MQTKNIETAVWHTWALLIGLPPMPKHKRFFRQSNSPFSLRPNRMPRQEPAIRTNFGISSKGAESKTRHASSTRSVLTMTNRSEVFYANLGPAGPYGLGC